MRFPDCAVILGGQALNLNISNRFKELGLNVIVVDYREKIDVSCDQHLIHDAKDPNIGQYLAEKGIGSVKCVYTSMDEAGAALHDVCKRYNLRCSDMDALFSSHDKRLMHQKWRDAGILNRFSQSFNTYDESVISEVNSKFDLVLKPSDSCASRGVTVIEKSAPLQSLRIAFDHAKSNSVSGVVNVEEFVHGQEFTVELLGDSYGNVAVYSISKKYHTKNAGANKIAVKLHYNPSDVDDMLYAEIAEFARICFRSVGLTCSLGHLEVIMKKDRSLTPVEIGSRSSGFIASDLVDIASGRFFLKDYMDAQNGGHVRDGMYSRGENSSMYFFYDIPAESVAKRTSSILPYLRPFAKSRFYDRKKIRRGEVFRPLTADTDRPGYEILYGEKNVFTIQRLLKAEESFVNDLVGVDGEVDSSVPVFDSIVHPTIDGTWLNKRYDGLAHLSDLQDDMSTYNILKAFAVGMNGVGGYTLEGFLSLIQNDDRLFPIAFCELNFNAEKLHQIKRMGYVGIKIHPRLLGVEIDDPRILSIIYQANQIGLVVLLCSFSGITKRLSAETKELSYVLLHSGFDQSEKMLDVVIENNPHVLLDMSYTLCHSPQKFDYISGVIKKYPDRFCIGSDHPEINHLQLRRVLTRACTFLPMKDRHLLFYENLNRYSKKYIRM